MTEKLDLPLIIAVFGAHSGKKIQGRTRIQKIICLLQFKDKVPFSYNFKSYYYGPYSDDLSEDINNLVGMKLIKEDVIFTRYGSYRYDYNLTDKGNLLFLKMNAKSPTVINNLDEKVKKYSVLRTPDLVKLAKDESGIPSLHND